MTTAPTECDIDYDLLAQNERIMASQCDAAIEAFQHGKLKKVTYLSSSMVFESTETWPSKEGDERKIPPPLSSYGFQKLAVEYFAKAAWDQYKVPYTIVYGDRESDESLAVRERGGGQTTRTLSELLEAFGSELATLRL